MNETVNATLVSASVAPEVVKYPSAEDDPYRVYGIDRSRNEGPLTPVHYIVIVLIIYMGGIAVLIMKSVQKDNEVLRYAHYYENFVKRPQFNRPQLLPSYSSDMLRKYSQNGTASRCPQLPTIPDEDNGEELKVASFSNPSESSGNETRDQNSTPDDLCSVIVIQTSSDSHSQSDFV